MADTRVLRTDLSHVLERITDGFFALDSQWRIVYINAEARNLLRAGSADLTGKSYFEAFPKARGTAFESHYRRALREQVPVQFTEFSHTSQRWLEVKAYPSADGLSVYFHDTTARMRAERELEARSAQLQAVIAFGQVAIAGASIEQLRRDAVEMLTVYLDVPIAEYHRYDRDNDRFILVESEGWGEVAEVRDNATRESQLGEALRSAQPVVTNDVRIDARFSDRRAFAPFGVRSGLCVLVGSPQKPVGVLSAYATAPRTFTTNDVRFVESIATMLGEAKRTDASNRRTLEILESITDGFVAVDGDLRVTYVNERTVAYWGRPREEIVGHSIAQFAAQREQNAEVQRYREVLRTRRPLTFEAFHPRFEQWFETRLFPYADGVAAYIRDITKRKAGEIRMQEMNAELERRVRERTQQLELANKELESFAYSVSHDLRAPLRAIDGFSQAIEEDCAAQLDTAALGYLRRVRRAAQRMSDLIDALLKLARVARAPITFQRIDLSALAIAVVADLCESEPERSVRIEIAEGLHCCGEPMLVRAVLDNLIGNAWKFTRRAPDARIEIGAADGGEFFVRDNGAGFDMAYANKLFGAFARLHAAEEYEGTGIGLATVARIVHRHGGEIRAQGEVGKGATFFFTLPTDERVVDG